MESLSQDLRSALRSLRKRPAVAALVVLTLALAIGANVAIFSTVYGVLLRPLPYPHPDRLTVVWARWASHNIPRVSHTGGDFLEYQRQARSFSGLAAVGSLRQNLTGTDQPAQVQVGWVSRNFFAVLGVQPALGRDFGPHEPPGSLIVGHEFWHRHFGGDAAVLGRAVRLDGQPFTIVGVLPAGFKLLMAADVGISTDIDVWKPPDEAGAPARWTTPTLKLSTLRVIGRLRPGVGLAQARSEMEGIAGQLRARYPDHAEVGFHLSVQPLHQEVVGHVRPALLALQGAVALVLLIACLNVANLLLASAYERRREFALRLSLGSEPWRIVRQVLLETLALAVAGGAVGVLLARQGIRLLAALEPARFPRLDSIAINSQVLLFALAATLAATVFSGVLPAARIYHWDLSAALRRQSATARHGDSRLRQTLILIEVALSLVLLLGAGLLLHSFSRLQQVRPGFDPQGLLTFSLSLPDSRYAAPVGTDQFLRRFEGRIEGLPGVVSAATVWPLPLEGQIFYGPYRVADHPPPGGVQPLADYRVITPDYPRTMGVRLISGRLPRDGERDVVLVDARFAERNWPGRSALDRTVYLSPDSKEVAFRVIGVLEDIRHQDLRADGKETLYLTSSGWSWNDYELCMVVRAATDPRQLVAPIRGELRRLDPQIPMAKVRLMTDYVSAAQSANRFAATLMLLFAAVAVALAAVGLYGTVSYSVSRGTREIGIRMALGAQRFQIFWQTAREGMVPTLLGVAAGLAGSFLLTGLISSLLFDVHALDPATYWVVPSLFVLIALAACLFPARRATALDPTRAIRDE
jgi:putative ABC transport system permease protein